MPLPAWLPVIGAWLAKHLKLIFGIAAGITGLYYMWQFGSAILGGVQQAAPGVGQATAAVGMLFALLPPMLMMMMLMWMFSTFVALFR